MSQVYHPKKRNWCFTLNNPEMPWVIPEIDDVNTIRYCVGQVEEGEEGTPHVQGYVEFTTPRTMAFVQGILGPVHLEPRMGTAEQARDYCMKSEGRIDGPWEVGVFKGKQGRRGDLEGPIEAVLAGSLATAIADEFPRQYIMYHRGIDKLIDMRKTVEEREVQVYVFWGESGTGKSRACRAEWPLLYSKPKGNWWNGYYGEETILLEDFYGEIPLDEMLTILDRYPLRVPTKGGFVKALYNTVLITSNRHPREWFADPFNAFARRITHVYHYERVTALTNDDPYDGKSTNSRRVRRRVDTDSTGTEVVGNTIPPQS